MREKRLSRFRLVTRPLQRRSIAGTRLDWILHVIELLDFDVDQIIADLLDPADIDGLYDVARLRIDQHRPTRTLPGHSLHGCDEAVAVSLAAGLLECLIDEM